MEQSARAVAVSSPDNLICVGTVKGKLLLYSKELNLLDSQQTVFTKENQWIQDIKFSPKGDMVAFGAHGGVSPVVVYSVTNKKLKLYA